MIASFLGLGLGLCLGGGGPRSVLRFRPRGMHFTGFTESVSLEFAGKYVGGRPSSRVIVNGHDLGQVDAGTEAVVRQGVGDVIGCAELDELDDADREGWLAAIRDAIATDGNPLPALAAPATPEAVLRAIEGTKP